MSLRIEQTDPLTLMRELPEEWAQTCVTRPPDASRLTLEVLAEVHRALRDDGTLWLLGALSGELLGGLFSQGWVNQQLPACLTPLARARGAHQRVVLLTKGRAYFSRCHLFHPHPQLHPACCGVVNARVARRARACTGGREHAHELVKRCVLVSTSIRACGACGAPYRQTRPDDQTRTRRQATCIHNDPRGRCLVLDPFYEPRAGTAEIAVSHERSFLAIHNPERGGDR